MKKKNNDGSLGFSYDQNNGIESSHYSFEGDYGLYPLGKKEIAPKIKIIGRQIYEPYRISPDERSRLHHQYGNDPFLLIFNDKSCSKLKDCIAWGHRTHQNHVEQGGILLGRVWRYKNEVFSFVEDCILANTQGSSAFVEFTPDMWATMQQELDSLNSLKAKEDKMAIIGWFHTHPNELSVFMSGTDQNTQNKNFSQDWQVSVVLNPHKRILRAFFGDKIRDGQIIGWTDSTSANVSDYGQNPHDPFVPNGSQKELRFLKQENLMLQQTAHNLRSWIKRLLCVGLIVSLLFFAAGFITGNKIYTPNTIDNTSETPELQLDPESKTTPEPESISELHDIKASVVMFYITSEQWNAEYTAPRFDVIVKGVTDSGKPHYSRHSIEGNSNDAYIELDAGSYEMTILQSSTVNTGVSFGEEGPLRVNVDGIKPKLIFVEFAAEEKSAQEFEDRTEDDSSNTDFVPNNSLIDETSDSEFPQ